ncbi:Utrophin [Varanus komodoensis]|nr:Utrophin [Varanus komodoensis]
MLQVEYEQLKEQHLRRGINAPSSPPDMAVSPQHTSEDAELIAEAKLLRQHKGRLEARMQILEDHNKQLESQLHRLRQLLEQPETDARVNGGSSCASPQRSSLSYSPDQDTSSQFNQAGVDDLLVPPHDTSTDLTDVMEQINSTFPACRNKAGKESCMIPGKPEPISADSLGKSCWQATGNVKFYLEDHLFFLPSSRGPFLQMPVSSSRNYMAAWDRVLYCLALCVLISNEKTLELPKDEDVVIL